MKDQTYLQNAKDMRSLKNSLEGVLLRDAERHVRSLAYDNPQFKDLNYKIEVFAYKKRPAGFSKVYPALVDEVVKPDNMEKTQKELIEIAQKKFSSFEIPSNIFSKQLKSNHIDRLTVLANRHLNPHRITFKGCKTLSDIRKQIKAAKCIEKADYKFNGQITISEDTVTIKRKSYPIEVRGAGDYKYPAIRITMKDNKRVWVRVDVLASLLGK